MESSNRIIEHVLRKASAEDVTSIWLLLQKGIAKRKEEGSNQWQDGYPNELVVKNDILLNYGYVIENEKDQIVGYFALIFDVEPAYEKLEGTWLSDQEYAVIHRLVTDPVHKVKGLAEWILLEIESIVQSKSVYSIKVDTNFDNGAMLYLFNKLGYKYCGEVYFRGSARKAFEKLL